MFIPFGNNFGFQRPNRGVPQYHDMLAAYPAAAYDEQRLETMGKILLPQSVINQVLSSTSPSPMLFCLQNLDNMKQTFQGVLEFSSPDGVVILPQWVFDMLCLYEGQQISITLTPEVTKNKGNFAQFRPHQTELMTSKFDAILEYVLRNFPVLHKGDTIPVKFNNKIYQMDILEVKPVSDYNAICIIDTDLNVDFTKPIDYVEPIKRPKPLDNKLNATGDPQKKNVQIITQENFKQMQMSKKDEYFKGKVVSVNGKAVDLQKLQSAELEKQRLKEEQRLSWDPRKHRIQHGIKTEKSTFENLGTGLKIGKTK